VHRIVVGDILSDIHGKDGTAVPFLDAAPDRTHPARPCAVDIGEQFQHVVTPQARTTSAFTRSDAALSSWYRLQTTSSGDASRVWSATIGPFHSNRTPGTPEIISCSLMTTSRILSWYSPTPSLHIHANCGPAISKPCSPM
jgi:hypothetical protein